jgi:hypothetical protein
LTAAGHVSLKRVYFDCQRCAEGAYAADVRLGVESGQTRQARRVLCLAGTSWSFAAASAQLREFCGLRVSPGTIRKVCDSEARQVECWQANVPEATAKYRETAGEIEFFTDGTCINTVDGWKEMRIGVFCKRPLGQPAPPERWNQRELPSTRARHAFAALESADVFAARWPVVAGRLGIRQNRRIDVIADGARWIWDRVDLYWPAAEGTLDIFHALEHVGATAKALYGEGTLGAQQWNEQARNALLFHGHAGIDQQIVTTTPIAVRAAQRASLRELKNYFQSHASRLNYAARLAEGRVIGSGQVEGACKHWIGRRLKQTGARWHPQRATRLAGLCALNYTDQWAAYWAKPNNRQNP